MITGIIAGFSCAVLFGIISLFFSSRAYIPFVVLVFLVPLLVTRHLLYFRWQKTMAREAGCSAAMVRELGLKYKVMEINYGKINIWVMLLLLTGGLSFMSYKIKDRETQLALLVVNTSGTVSGIRSHRGVDFAVITFQVKNKKYTAELKLHHEFGKSYYMLPDTIIFPKAGDIFTIRYSVKNPEINEVIPNSLLRK